MSKNGLTLSTIDDDENDNDNDDNDDDELFLWYEWLKKDV